MSTYDAFFAGEAVTSSGIPTICAVNVSMRCERCHGTIGVLPLLAAPAVFRDPSFRRMPGTESEDAVISWRDDDRVYVERSGQGWRALAILIWAANVALVIALVLR